MEALQQEFMDNKKKKVRHRRKWLTLEEKLKIIEANEKGKTSTRIARDLDMNESSVRSILRKKHFYKSLGNTKCLHRFKSFARCRSLLIDTMERHLTAWIEDNNRKKIQLTEMDIQKKALALFNELKPEKECSEKFSASRGWFYRFKNRINLKNCILSSDKPPPDMLAAAKFQQQFADLVEKEGYTHHQIFNVEETSLYWKKMPSLTFLLENEKNPQGYKPSKDALTLSLGANAAGDLKLKPLIVYRSETPSALRDCDKNSLPVIWRSNKKAWLSKELFKEWFTDYFCPTVETYCHTQGLEFKILLLLDFTRSQDGVDCNENIKVLYLPENTASLLQPMTLGVFPVLKATYLRKILSEALYSAPVSLEEFWSRYNIRKGIENIHGCWSDTSPEDLVSSWHQLIPDVKMKDFESKVAAIAQEVVTMGQCLGFKTIDVEKVQKCIESSQCEEWDSPVVEAEEVICKEEVVILEYEEQEQGQGQGQEQEQEQEQEEEEEAEQRAEVEQQKEPSVEELERIVGSIDIACETIAGCDSNIERSIKVRQALQNGIQAYRDLYLLKIKQSQ